MGITWKSRELVRLEHSQAVNELGKASRREIERLRATLQRGGGLQKAVDDRHVECIRQSFKVLRELYIRAFEREGVPLTIDDVDEIVGDMSKGVQSLFQSRMELEPRSVGIGFRENLDQVVREERHALIVAMTRGELERQLAKIAEATPAPQPVAAVQPAPAPAQSLRVFVCSTYADLAEERGLVLDAIRRLQQQHHAMEYFGARSDAPIETCLEEVRKSDLVVVIVGHRYGSLVPGRDISYSQAEYEEAFRLQRLVHVYMRRGEPSGDDQQEPEQQRRLDAFKALLSSRHTVHSFENGQTLPVQVVADISRVLTSGVKAQPATAPDEAKRPFRSTITLVIKKLERLLKEDLVALFMQADRGRWPGHLDVAPENLQSCIQRAQEFDADLYERLNHLNTRILDPARLTLGRMTQKASDMWEQHPDELAALETEFKGIARSAVEEARAALEYLDRL
jgi:hypothetical protein